MGPDFATKRKDDFRRNFLVVCIEREMAEKFNTLIDK